MPDSSDHIAEPGKWSYACKCLRCRWEQWWNEENEPHPAVSKPTEPYPEDSNTESRPE